MKFFFQYLSIFINLVLRVFSSSSSSSSSLSLSEFYMYEPLYERILPIPGTRIIQSRITGGEVARPHAYPYTVGLNIIKDSGKIVWCGGALISDEWVLTAAHCIKKGRDVMIHIGCHNRNKDCQRIRADKNSLIKHENYNGRSLANDIGLIKLPETISLDDKVQIISLPKKSRSYQGKWATTAGWGVYSDSLQTLSNVLRVVQVPIITRKSCQNRYTSILIRESNICAASPSRRSTCAGDSGGPLVMNDHKFDDKILIGITSFGYKRGCEKGWPAVFTKVSSYLDWIKDKTGIE